MPQHHFAFRIISLKLLIVLSFVLIWNSQLYADTESPKLLNTSEFGLKITQYAPGKNDPAVFKLTTHIAFGPGKEEIITDLKNNRLMYRNGPGKPLVQSPIPLKGQHSVLYNPKDRLYYVNDTDNHRLISFADLSKPTITAQTNTILGIKLERPHDIVIDPKTGWIYAINPNSGHIFRFSAIGENESVLDLGVALGGYARSLTFSNGRLYAMGSAAGRIVEITDWEKAKFTIYKSFGKVRVASGGTWKSTGLIINDAEFFNGSWYATSYFSPRYSKDTDHNKNKLIRFKTLPDLVSGNWEDLSSLLPDKSTPYYFTVNDNSLYLAIYDHTKLGKGGDVILKLTPSP
jgi:hypothetical protein